MAVTLKKSVTKTAIYARCRVRFVTRNFCDSKFAPERAERAGSTLTEMTDSLYNAGKGRTAAGPAAGSFSEK